MSQGGLKVEATDGVLRIVNEGARSKFVQRCQMVCFSGAQAVARGQEILYVTERAVFRLAEHGLELVEVAPGIDVRSQVLALADFPIHVSAELRTMDPRLFRDQRMDLKLEPRAEARHRRAVSLV
jgi:propionate CoA-transferase